MMLIPTYVAPSPIEGVGIFTDVFIPAGTQIWCFDPVFDRAIPADQIVQMPEAQRLFIERYGYPHMLRSDMIVLEADNGRFMNHSDRPNTIFTDPDRGYAKYDIPAGSELLCDYGEFDPTFVMQPGRIFIAEPPRAEMRLGIS